MIDAEIVRVEEALTFALKPVGVAAYDFDFSLHFRCSHPYRIESEQLCVLRTGAPADYTEIYDKALTLGLRLVNSPAQHSLASEIECWYPRLEGMTPRTLIYEALPQADEIESDFDWPIFLKGSRQTSQHNPELSIIRDREHYERAMAAYRRDPILHWQKPAIREFIDLASAPGSVPGKIRPSIEFRSFWWHGRCVGCGPYWYQLPTYTSRELASGLRLASEAVSRLDVPFVVIDFARTTHDEWIIIECNDAQESGHAGIVPQLLWRQVLECVAA